MTRSGYTLIELLGATALLTALAFAVASLIALMVRDVPELTARDRWQMSADATLRLLQNNASEVRPVPATQEAPSIIDQIMLEGNVLMLTAGGTERVLLGEVAVFEVVEDELNHTHTVTIRSTFGEVAEKVLAR